jgi:ATP-dependent helicase HrpB
MVLAGAAAGDALRAARIAVLLTERGLGGSGADIATRLEGFQRDRSSRARGAEALARRWAALAGGDGGATGMDDGLLLAEAFPERIAKARGKQGEFLLSGGRGAWLDPADPLAREPWLAVAELGGGETRDRILLAARLDPEALKTAFASRLNRQERLETGPSGALRAKQTLWLGRLAVEERLIADPSPALIREALIAEAKRSGLPWGEASAALQARLAFLRQRDSTWPDLSSDALSDDWVGAVLEGKTSLAAVGDRDLEAALLTLIPWDLRRRLEIEAPARWTAPTGSSFDIDYAASSGPRVEARVQELFGLAVHPTVAGVPLTLALLSPARRPIQITADLPGFWKTSWADVRKDMRGRYPKHPWPEDPASASPTTRVKAKG